MVIASINEAMTPLAAFARDDRKGGSFCFENGPEGP
jgi:hypothetical protein